MQPPMRPFFLRCIHGIVEGGIIHKANRCSETGLGNKKHRQRKRKKQHGEASRHYCKRCGQPSESIMPSSPTPKQNKSAEARKHPKRTDNPGGACAQAKSSGNGGQQGYENVDCHITQRIGKPCQMHKLPGVRWLFFDKAGGRNPETSNVPLAPQKKKENY